MRFITLVLAGLALFWSTLLIYDSLFPPVSTLMAAQLVQLEVPHRRFVPLNRLSPWLVRGAIAAEDGKFCDHHGVDWESLRKAVTTTLDDPERAHGASTITMQVAKNLFLWPSRSYVRKGMEIPIAIVIDALWGKRKMMETYLNIAEFGDGIYGVEAAARSYFHKPANQLSRSEAALLIAALPNPRSRNAARPDSYHRSYAASIAARAPGVTAGCTARH
ncbi:MAG: monofunctional biosynthetic peptidoglycan transglycosylase [Rickettsiales bacterium]